MIDDLRHYRAPEPEADLGIFWLCVVVILVCLFIPGCAAPGFDYAWTQAREPSLKPWLYVVVSDPDRTCRDLGTSTLYLGRIAACATWKPVGGVIYLPKDAPRWMIEHEERHLEGWVHP